MKAAILSVVRINKRFGGLTAVHDISFDVLAGEVIGLMGPNGAGKTTLLNVLSGEYRPDSGAIKFKGRDIVGLPPHKICHIGIARTYQIPQPFTLLSVRENILVLVFITSWQIAQISLKPLAINGLRYFSRFQNEYGKAYYL